MLSLKTIVINIATIASDKVLAAQIKRLRNNPVSGLISKSIVTAKVNKREQTSTSCDFDKKRFVLRNCNNVKLMLKAAKDGFLNLGVYLPVKKYRMISNSQQLPNKFIMYLIISAYHFHF